MVYVRDRSAQTDGNVVDQRQLSQRIRLVAANNPYMADDLPALTAMGMSNVSTDDLVANAGQMYAMATSDNLANQLKGLSPGAQRAIVARLAPGQQQALAQMGYQQPDREEGSLLGSFASIVAKPIGVISRGIAGVPGIEPVVGGALEGLTWVANQPGHFYRTMRVQDDGTQWAALAGGIAGLAAVALAVPTGGGSLMALGALGLGATAGGAAASFGFSAARGAFDNSATTNPGDWIRAFNATTNGEKVFDIHAQKKASEILGDPRMVGAAYDLSALGIDVVEFAHEMAGHRNVDVNSQLREIQKMAAGMAAPGSQAFQQAVTAMTNVMSDQTFQQAVQTLNNGKISPGRDFAAMVPFIEYDSAAHSVVSGMTDAIYTIAVDPLLMLGLGSELYKAKRYTFDAFTGGEAASAFRKFVTERPSLMRNYHALAGAVENGSIQELRQRAPHLQAMYGDLVTYRQTLVDTGKLTNKPFQASDIIEYIAGEAKFKPLLEGIGSVRNPRGGIQLVATSASKELFREFRGNIRSIVDGMADIGTEARFQKLVKEAGKNGAGTATAGDNLWEAINLELGKMAKRMGRDFEQVSPNQLDDLMGEDGVIGKPWEFLNELNPHAYSVGRAFAGSARKVPVIGRSVGKLGEIMTSMTTMSITGKAFHISGAQAPKEIRALAELGRYMGMPSYYRRAWTDVILQADSAGARMDAVHGYLANMMKMTGIDSTVEGERIVDIYLKSERKLYGAGDEIMANGYKVHDGLYFNEQADMMVMPDLHELRKAALSGHISKLMGIADLPVVEAGINKVWKPAVLLRIGFIPRAAGEELAAFMLRDGFGSLTQQMGSRNIANWRTYQHLMGRKAAAEAIGEVGAFTKSLTKNEQALLNAGRTAALPAHLRPVARMFERSKWRDPAYDKFEAWGRFLERHLSTGTGNTESVDRALGAFAGQNVADLDRRLLEAGADIKGMRVLDKVRAAQQRGILPLNASAQRRLNVGDYADNLLLGNPYSIRRMMLGGVHTNIVEGGMQWAKIHSTTVMREASARNQGPVSPMHDPTQTYKEMQRSKVTGEMRPVVMLRVKGERRTVANGDEYFIRGYDEEMARPMADPAFRLALNEHMVRVLSPNVTQAQIEEAATRTHNLGMNDEDMVGQPGSKAIGYHGRNILRELIGPEFKRDQWDVMLTEMANTETGEPLARALRTYIGQFEDPTIDSVMGALNTYKEELTRGYADQIDAFREMKKARARGDKVSPHALPHTTLESKEYYEKLNRVNQLINGLETNVVPTIKWAKSLPLEDQHYVAQFTHQQIVGGQDSFWAKHTRLQAEKAAQGPLVSVWEDPALEAFDSIATRLKAGKKVSFGRTNQNKIRKAINKLDDEGLADHEQAVLVEALRLLDLGEMDPTIVPEVRQVFNQVNDMIQRHKTVRPEGLAGPEDKWSYDTLDEAYEAMVSYSAAKVLDPNVHDAGLTKSLRPLQRDAEGQFVDTQFRDGTVVIYDAPRFQNVTYDQILANSLDRELVSANRGTIEGILFGGGEGDSVPLIANQALATELHRVNARMAGVDVEVRPHSLRMPRKITDGRQWDALYPHAESKVRGQTQLWHMPKEIADKKLMPTPDELIDPATEWARTQVDNFFGLVRRGDQQQVRPKMRTGEPLADGAPQYEHAAFEAVVDMEKSGLNAFGNGEQAMLEDAVDELLKRSDLSRAERKTLNDINAELDSGMFDPRGPKTADESISYRDDGHAAYAMTLRHETQFNDVVAMIEKYTPRGPGTPTEIPMVYRWENGQHVPYQKDEIIPLADADRLLDHRGQPIVYGHPDYFEAMQKESMDNGRPMWEILGNRMRDLQNDIYNATRWQQKPMTVQISKGAHSMPIQSNDSIPLRIASTTDIERVDANDLPRNAITEIFDKREVGRWEQAVQFGFDRVIGPSIDAIVRRPMAYNAFIQRYISNKNALSWTLDGTLTTATTGLMRAYGAANHNIELNPKELAKMARSIVSYQGDKNAAKWTTDEAMAWLRGHSQDEMADLLQRTLISSNGKTDAASRAANVYARQLARQDFPKVQAALSTGTTPEAFITTIESALPEGALRSANSLKSKAAREAIEANPLLKWIDNNEHWATVQAMHKNIEHTKTTAGELAALGAISDIVPFLDSHEFKTQFADYGKGFLPFWYAEENFMKRWARGIAQEGPALIRRAQLTYMGLKTAGIVRTDESGKDWFVYPGSGLLAGAIERIPGMSGLQQMGMMFQTPTDQMLPGLNNRFGTPSFNPLVTIPMELVVKAFPELAPVERAVLGDFASGQKISNMMIPAHFRNIWNAFFNDDADGNTRFASAMTTAMAYMEAHDKGLPDNATPGQTQDYLDRIRKHARIIVLVQAIGGFFVPGSPSPIATGDASLTGIGVENPGEYLNSQYVQLVQTLGIEEGTAKFLEMNADASVDDIVNPLAYTIPKNESVSGAPIPSTMAALEFYDDNADYMNEFPNAAPWLLPQSQDPTDRSQYAYDQLTADGLRKRRTPEEFFRAMKFKGAAQEYFAIRDAYGAEVDKANVAGDTELARGLAAERDYKLQVYRMGHPLFAEELQSSDGRAQRTRTLNELRYIVDDPRHPQTDNFEEIKMAVELFDRYKTRLAVLGNDRSAQGVAEVEHLKEQYSSLMGQLVDATPTLMSLWVSVLRPESSLD